RRSSPSSRTRPPTMRAAGRGTSRSTDRHVMLLPDPDSPTSPSVSPSATAKETPSTALIVPHRVTMWVRRSSTAMTGGLMSEGGRRRARSRGGAAVLALVGNPGGPASADEIGAVVELLQAQRAPEAAHHRRQARGRRIGQEHLDSPAPKRKLDAELAEQRRAPGARGHDDGVARE